VLRQSQDQRFVEPVTGAVSGIVPLTGLIRAAREDDPAEVEEGLRSGSKD
jgi:hypothetical protein